MGKIVWNTICNTRRMIFIFVVFRQSVVIVVHISPGTSLLGSGAYMHRLICDQF